MGTNRQAAPATTKLMLKHSFEDDESDGMTILFYIADLSSIYYFNAEYERSWFAKEHAAKVRNFHLF
jgi:hypothetical protein